MPAKKIIQGNKVVSSGKAPAQPDVVFPPIEDEGEEQQEQKYTDPADHKLEPPKRRIAKSYSPNQSEGQGRRICPDCKKYTGTATNVCVCGYEFPISDKKGPKTEKTQEEKDAAKAYKTSKVQELETDIIHYKQKIERLERQVSATKVDRIAFLRVLRSRNFEFKVLIDPLDEESKPEISGNPEVEKLVKMINFGGMNENSLGLFCVSTNPVMRFSIDLDTLLNLLKMPARK